MEMELANELVAAVERLSAAAVQMELCAVRLASQHTELAASASQGTERNLSRVVATIEGSRENELAQKLVAAEQRIAELEAHAAVSENTGGRKTQAPGATSLLAKHGMTADNIQAGALDAALVHLALEQRIAVKSELLRAGLLG
jgi:hypothetical protein